MVKTLRGMAIVIIILVFIGGIVAGNVYAPEPLRVFEDKKFLWSIALMWWVAGGVSSVFVFAFSTLLEHVQGISSRLDEIETTTRRIHREIQE
ncbi:hypothetical protein [Paenibacillus macquariensis]|uniref:Uncharacterized protein n=1 Tax=Paenibacillus macquariensis TaxID=948756 RepID=A0ABY1K779_9BACL|nr:hypothetical protein [Paenibacillus macquariensis]MEC0092517.1 hypothetical protein [Paenibacillus macquariensis]OAB35473.1 hypothetical protein PMSM_09465 [Paenibacillus macquariensis subsp. macquariensis]SIR35165.1 hypothetical protein SAMN05421578_111149 [Paenibacillus macquariensis]